MFNLLPCLLLIQSGAGFKAISRHTRPFIPLQAQSGCWYSCNKAMPALRWGVGGLETFSLRGSSVCLPKIEKWLCQIHRLWKAWGELSTVQITGASARTKKEGISLPKQAVQRQIQTPEVDVLHEWEEGKNSDYRVGEKVTKGIGGDNFSFFLLCLYRVDTFLPHSESVFPCWLKHSRTEPEN